MILTDDMLMAAFRYRETKLWEYLDDSNLFAFRLSDGETGYCCVMGNAGEHLALGFYRGAKGFSTYIKSINIESMSRMEIMEQAHTFDCINCDYMNSANTQELDKEMKARIREFAKNNGFKIHRPNGWPDFTRHSPGKMPFGIVNERDAMDITEALNAAVEVAERLKAGRRATSKDSIYGMCGFDIRHRYPSVKGGKSVPFLIPEKDGSYTWSKTKLPAAMKDSFPETKYDNQIVAAYLRKKIHHGTLLCRVVHIPATVNDAPDGIPYFPSVLLCVKEDDHLLFPILPSVPIENDPVQTLHKLASVLMDANGCPQTIKVSDSITKNLLSDFCKKAGIEMQEVAYMAEIDNALRHLLMNIL